MKIAILSLWAQKLFRQEEPQPFGGAELQLKILATALAEKPETEVHFITRGQGPSETFPFEKFIVHKLPYRKSSLARYILGSWDIYKKLLSLKADVLIQRGGGIETGITASAALVKKIPFIFMTSAIWDVDGTHAYRRGLVYGKTYLYGLMRASAVIVQSEIQQELLQNNYGVSSTLLRSAHAMPKEISNDKKGVLWISRCERNKRPDILLDLAEQLPHQQFTVVCPKANDLDFYNSIVERSRQYKNVSFHSGLPFEETEQLFASHRVFIITSEYEGFPNTFVQASKYGTPILSLYVNPDNILNHHRIGLFADGDMLRMQDSLKILLGNQELWEQFSKNARKYALEFHDVNKITDRFFQIIADTVQQKK